MTTQNGEMIAELARRQSNREAVADYFKAHPLEWIPAATLAHVAGALAWRTRISDVRLKDKMVIENKQEREEHRDGTISVSSWYRYNPTTPLGRPADVPAREQQPDTLFALWPRP